VHAGVYGPVDYVLGDTRVVANPRGVANGDEMREVPNFSADYTIVM
jgi:hypothetical protein